MLQVLLIDDDEVLLGALSSMIGLRIEGARVHTAASPDAALSLLRHVTYDIILSDVQLPQMDGLALLDRMRTLQPHTPVILMTGHGDEALRRQTLRSGAAGFLLKPLDRDEVTTLLKAHLRAAGAEEAAFGVPG